MPGPALLLGTMACSLLLVLRPAMHDTGAAWPAGVVVWFLLCWVGLPLWARFRSTPRGED